MWKWIDVEPARVADTRSIERARGAEEVSRQPGPATGRAGSAGTRRALVSESPLANSVTSCPSPTSSSVRYDTTRSVPP